MISNNEDAFSIKVLLKEKRKGIKGTSSGEIYKARKHN